MKAFDKVWHNGIIYKMAKIQVPLYIIEWVKNFLSNRMFYVQVNNFESERGEIRTGVPQGAVISPILFTIFINDIPKENQKNKSYSLLFADDLLTFFIFNRYGNIRSIIRTYLKKIEDWLAKWKMKMAPDKCSYLIFSGNPGKTKPLDIEFLGKNIPYVKNPVFLGIKLDEKLCYNAQVEHIRNKCLNRLNIIKIISNKYWKLSKDTLLNIYNSLIGSVLDYSFFGTLLLANTNLHQIQVIQNIALKSIFRLPYDTPSDKLTNLMNEKKIENIRKRAESLFLRYLISSLNFSNQLIIELIDEFFEAFINSSRFDLKNNILLNKVWEKFFPSWNCKNGRVE